MPTLAHRPSPAAGSLSTSVAAGTAAAFSLSAGLVHFGYTSTHWWIWWAYGVFFLGVGIAQTLLAGVLVLGRPSPWLCLSGIALNLGVIVMYVVSRTPYGAPLGPMRGHAELPGRVDMATTLGELVTVVALLVLLPRPLTRRVTTVLLVAGVALWALRFTGRLAY